MASEAVTSDEGPDELIGKVLDDRYRIEAPLGQGGIGRVYKARHLILGNHVALKVLLAQYESIPVLQERFRREAEALAALSHPNIVTVTDFGVAEAMPYLVMELLEGEDLAALIDREVIEPSRCLALIRQVLRALAYAHSRGLVHRDLKPHNVWVRSLGDGTDHVKVLDFGLARFLGDSANRGPKLTKVGALIGTPAYMAPEQASGEAVDARADVYSTGIVFFEALTGRKPFESKTPAEMLRQHLLSPPPKLSQADSGLAASDGLEQLVRRALAKLPKDRFASAQEMIAALDALGTEPVRRVGDRPPRDRPVSGVDPTQAAPGARVAAPKIVPRASSPSVEAQKTRAPVLAAIGCAAGVLVGGILALMLLFADGIFGERPPTGGASASDRGPTPVPPTAVPIEPARPAPRDPFVGGEPLPPDIVALHERISNGARPEERQLRSVSRYASDHHDDPRPRLILAHARANRNWADGALQAYLSAYVLDQSVRGDPRMLPDALRFVRTAPRGANPEASDFVTAVYGMEAEQAIRTQLEGRLPENERSRLEALLARIRESEH